MHYPLLKLFVDVAELGSLTKVALAHGTTQPYISRQISELERECGGRLFQRTGRGVVLTELGQRIEPKVRKWLDETDQLVSDIKSTAGTPIGTVRIGIMPSTAHPLVSTLYYRLQQKYPQVKLVVREGQGAQLDTWLDNGGVDLALLYRHSAQPANGDIYLIETQTYLVGAAGDALTSQVQVPFSALHKLPLVLFCRPNSWRDRLDELSAAHGVTLNVAAEADSLSLQTEIVAHGGVYALLGPYAITSALRSGRIQAAPIVEPEMPRHIALAMSRYGQLTLACRVVMQLIEEIVPHGFAGTGNDMPAAHS
ncbi:MAG: LysR family transcriptional regulator [Pseudomonadota bacterium]